jgi:hypothetical protein
VICGEQFPNNYGFLPTKHAKFLEFLRFLRTLVHITGQAGVTLYHHRQQSNEPKVF